MQYCTYWNGSDFLLFLRFFLWLFNFRCRRRFGWLLSNLRSRRRWFQWCRSWNWWRQFRIRWKFWKAHHIWLWNEGPSQIALFKSCLSWWFVILLLLNLFLYFILWFLVFKKRHPSNKWKFFIGRRTRWLFFWFLWCFLLITTLFSISASTSWSRMAPTSWIFLDPKWKMIFYNDFN